MDTCFHCEILEPVNANLDMLLPELFKKVAPGIRKLRQFNEKSSNIFKEVESFQKNVQ